MGRQIRFIYGGSTNVLDDIFYEDDKNYQKICKIITNHKMKFWHFVDDRLLPLGCYKIGDELDSINCNEAKSSKEWLAQFDNDDFYFISETAIKELVDCMIKFEELALIYYIEDNQTGGGNMYCIRACSENKKVKICIEIIDLDDPQNKMETKRVVIEYD